MFPVCTTLCFFFIGQIKWKQIKTVSTTDTNLNYNEHDIA